MLRILWPLTITKPKTIDLNLLQLKIKEIKK